MISVITKKQHLIVYGEKVSAIDYFFPSVYTAFKPFRGEFKPVLGMVNDLRKTIWIDLTKTEDEILMGFKSNTRNEVRKAIKENYIVEREDDVQLFIEYYNAFAREKNLREISKEHITKYPNVLIYKCSLNGKVLSMHASILDQDLKIVRLLYSASVRFDEGVDRKSVGMSNRLLHYIEFTEFKKMGLAIYDFGGINEDESNKQQYNITIFKKSFGGEVIEEIHLCSVVMWLIVGLFNLLKK